jgi:hypothetical protein
MSTRCLAAFVPRLQGVNHACGGQATRELLLKLTAAGCRLAAEENVNLHSLPWLSSTRLHYFLTGCQLKGYG